MVWMQWDSPSFTSYSASFLLSQTCLQSHRHLLHRVQRERVWQLQSSTQCEIRNNGPGVAHVLEIDGVDERFLLAGSTSGGLSIFDLEATTNHHNNKKDVQIDEDEENTITQPRKKKTVIKPLKQNMLRSQQGNIGLVSSVDWYPNDCGVFIASSVAGSVALFDTSSMEKVIGFDFPNHKVHWSRFRPNACARPLIATAISNGSITLCDLNSGDKAHTIHAHSSDAVLVDWHPSFEYLLVSGGSDSTVKVWDIRKGGTSTPVLALDWRQDYAYKAGKEFDPVRMHNQGMSSNATPAFRHQLHSTKHHYGTAHEGLITSLRYSPCGQYLITTGNDRKIRTWVSQNGKLLPINYEPHVFSKMSFRLSIAHFGHSADDILVVPNKSQGEDEYTVNGKITLLPLHSGNGRPIKTLQGHFDSVETAVFRNSSQTLISSGGDGMILYWDSKDIVSHKDRKSKDPNRKFLSISNLMQPFIPERRSGIYCHFRSLQAGVKRKILDNVNTSIQTMIPNLVRQPFVPAIVETYLQKRIGSSSKHMSSGIKLKSETNPNNEVAWNNVDDLFRTASDQTSDQVSSSSSSSINRVVHKPDLTFEKNWRHLRRNNS